MGLPAARLTDMHVCPLFTGPVPHVGGPIIGPCSPNVLTGMLPQARITDMCLCVGPPDTIVTGAFTVLVNGLPAARMSDSTVHGGMIVTGLPTVLIGSAGGGGGGGGAGAGAGAGAAPPEAPNPFSAFFEWAFKSSPVDDPESSKKLAAEYELGKVERELARFGDEDNFLRLGTADASAKASAEYDIDKKQFTAGAEASAGIAGAKGQLQGSTARGMLSGKAEGEVLSASAKAGASLSAGAEGLKGSAEAGAEAVLAKGSAGGEVRITPKTMYDNSIGRVTGTELPKSWDKGLVVGATGEAGIGAAAKAKGEIVAKAGEWSMTGEAKAGAGPMLGGKLKIGAVW